MDWKDEIIESMQGARRAEPRPELLEAIIQRISASGLRYVSRMQVAMAAAGLVLVVSVNAWAWMQQRAFSTTDSSYNLSLTEFQLY